MFNFNERTTYDRIEDSVLSLVRGAIETSNISMLERGLPIIAVAEELEATVDEVTDKEYSTLAVSLFDSTDENSFTPKALHLNSKILETLSDDDITNVLSKLLVTDESYVTEKDMVTKELFLTDMHGDTLDATSISIETIVPGEVQEAEEDGGKSTALDFEALAEAMSKSIKDIEHSEEEEKEASKARVDKYLMSKEDTKISTIVSKDNNRYYTGKISKKNYDSKLEKVADVQAIIESSIEASGMHKIASDTPSKRLHIRNIVIGHNKEYFNKKMLQGKKLDVVIALDRSGSMGGQPAEDSAILITAFNNLAHLYKELTCTIILSDNSEYATIDLPVGTIDDKELLAFTRTHGAEGLAENMGKEIERLEKADVVFVYTDGDIVSGAVDKPLYTAKGIELIGLYTAHGSTGDKLSNEDYNRHYNKNKTWFHNVIVSTTPTDLAEQMADYMRK